MRFLMLAMCSVAVTAPHAVAAQARPSDAVDLAKLQGRYNLISGVGLNGKPFGPDDLKGSVRTMNGDHLTVTLAGRYMFDATVTMNSAVRPKTMEYRVTKGAAVGLIFSGLYELRGDTVRLCFGRPNAPRPTHFRAGKDQTYFVWVRDPHQGG
jgi:uncharacterized protein (TIGR03067 family)